MSSRLTHVFGSSEGEPLNQPTNQDHMSSSEEILHRRHPDTHPRLKGDQLLGVTKTLTKRLKTETREERTNRYDEFIQRVNERFEHHDLLDQPRTRPSVGFTDQDQTPHEVVTTPGLPHPGQRHLSHGTQATPTPLDYRERRRKGRWGRGETPEDFQRRRHTRRGGRRVDPRTGLRV